MPSNERQQWKTMLWLGIDSQEEVIFTGPSFSSLKDDVVHWLQSNQPTYISNYPIDSLVPFRRRVYAFCTHPQRADEVFPHLKQTRYLGYSVQSMNLIEGWHCTYFKRASSGRSQEYSPEITAIGDKEALAMQLRTSLVFWCGPDYIDSLSENGRIILERVMTVARTNETAQTNDMLQRGWRLISLEMKGNEDDTGRLVSQSATFVLGHPEADAT